MCGTTCCSLLLVHGELQWGQVARMKLTPALITNIYTAGIWTSTRLLQLRAAERFKVASMVFTPGNGLQQPSEAVYH